MNGMNMRHVGISICNVCDDDDDAMGDKKRDTERERDRHASVEIYTSKDKVKRTGVKTYRSLE